MTDIYKISDTYIANNIPSYPIAILKAKGSDAYDITGKQYIDMIAGIAVNNFGHGYPRLLNALISQANQLATLPRLFYQEPLAKLAKLICSLTNMDKLLPMNSGAEAVETAIKTARKWGYIHKKIPKNKAEIIVCDHSFHGRTITTVSMSSVSKYKEGFGPLTPGFTSIPFNNPTALEEAITSYTAAFLVEPIQGEAGVIIPQTDYLKKCEEICKKNNVLFIIDEIQTGMGRTGKLLASQHYLIQPDGVVMGKATGGGLLPISFFLAKSQLMNVLKPGDHGSTFGGNPLASAVALEALHVLIDESLCQRATTLGEYFLEQLQQISSPIINDIRGLGLFIAIEFNASRLKVGHIVQQLLNAGLLSLHTRENIIRLLPPLTIPKNKIDQTINIIQTVLNISE